MFAKLKLTEVTYREHSAQQMLGFVKFEYRYCKFCLAGLMFSHYYQRWEVCVENVVMKNTLGLSQVIVCDGVHAEIYMVHMEIWW